jgi:hypothetical protein
MFSLLAMDDTALPGVDCHLGPVGDVKFAQDVTDMPFDGVLAEGQLFGDLAVAETPQPKGRGFLEKHAQIQLRSKIFPRTSYGRAAASRLRFPGAALPP